MSNRDDNYEEVNAWGNYEQTARNARSWKPGHGKKLRSESITISEKFTLDALETGEATAAASGVPDFNASAPIIGHSGARMGASSSDWNKYLFNTKSTNHLQTTEDIADDKQQKIKTIDEHHEDDEEDGKDFPKKEPDVHDLLVKDEDDLDEDKNAINNLVRDIFGVYFEDASSIVNNASNSKKIMVTSPVEAIIATMPWLRGYIKREVGNLYLRNLALFTEMCLRGISQVYFQNNPVSGLLILLGMYLQSSRIATHGVIALVSANLTALLLGFDRPLVNGGLFGYNAFLVGLAFATFYSGEEHHGYYGPVLLGTVVFSSFTSILFVMMGKVLVPYKSPPLTLPFNVATLMFLAAMANMSRVEMDPVRTPSIPDYSGTTADIDTNINIQEFLSGVVRGIGQVYLADNLDSGLLVLAGIAVCSRIAALAAFAGSALGALVALANGVPADAIEFGFYGFNCSLSVTAMFMFYAPSWGTAVFGVLAGVMTVLGQQALAVILEPYGLPFMTLPFCVVALPFIIIQGTTTLVVAIPLSSMTFPEDHLRRVGILNDGFHFLKDALNPDNDTNIDKFGKKTRTSVRKLSKSITNRNLFADDIDDEINKIRWWHTRERKKDAWVRASALKIFNALDVEQKGEIGVSQFEAAMKSSGLTRILQLHGGLSTDFIGLDTSHRSKHGRSSSFNASFHGKSGLRFACNIFCLMDLDDSETLTKEEFLAFATVSWSLYSVRRRMAMFFNFVDIDGNGYVDCDLLDDARAYLGQSCMTNAEQDALTNLTGEENEFDVDGLINFCTVAMVKIFVAAHLNQDDTASADVSRHRINTTLA